MLCIVCRKLNAPNYKILKHIYVAAAFEPVQLRESYITSKEQNIRKCSSREQCRTVYGQCNCRFRFSRVRSVIKMCSKMSKLGPVPNTQLPVGRCQCPLSVTCKLFPVPVTVPLCPSPSLFLPPLASLVGHPF